VEVILYKLITMSEFDVEKEVPAEHVAVTTGIEENAFAPVVEFANVTVFV